MFYVCSGLPAKIQLTPPSVFKDNTCSILNVFDEIKTITRHTKITVILKLQKVNQDEVVYHIINI